MPCGKAGRLPGAHPHATLLWLIPENIVLHAQGHGIVPPWHFWGALPHSDEIIVGASSKVQPGDT